jgi:hypothetical protein
MAISFCVHDGFGGSGFVDGPPKNRKGPLSQNRLSWKDSGEVCRSTYTRTMRAPEGLVKKRVGRKLYA